MTPFAQTLKLEYPVNFTREPIIETVITPREGCKLVVRNSKGNGQEDYFVDAIEVVSFGHSFFFRSQERPKSFLVPVSDYEILELKETRMVLKNVASDRPVKIGRGREESHRSQEAAPREESQDATLAESRPAPEKSNDPTRPASGKKNDKRRRGRRGRDRQDLPEEMTASNESEDRLPPEGDQLRHNKSNGSGENGEEKAPSFISKLFPPPTTLIKDSLSRYKQMEPGVPVEEKPAFEESIFEHPTPDTEVERDNEE